MDVKGGTRSVTPLPLYKHESVIDVVVVVEERWEQRRERGGIVSGTACERGGRGLIGARSGILNPGFAGFFLSQLPQPALA